MNIWEKLNISVNDWDTLLRYKFLENTTAGVFCDVGACNGLFTNLFKDICGKEGRVYSFELNPLNYHNILWLKDDNCIIENLAISEKSGEVEYYSNIDTAGDFTSNILGFDTGFTAMNKIGKIKSISLDEYFKDMQIDYLKIDVEGAEYDVIKGGLETLKKCKYVIIECHFQSDWHKIHDLLKENNLNFKNLTDDVPIFYGTTEVLPGIAHNGMPYQIYLKNE